MCGIAGVVRTDGRPVDAARLDAMTDVLAHRGPDGRGIYLDGPVGLGHRRLAIIDLSPGGAQPMASADGTTWITYNGEVYNYRELRRELEARGATFRTTSDTEVVLQAYAAWDLDVLARLRGMFAFALWDARQRRLLLARDRVGIKPLVYAWDGRALRFASELKAILQDPDVPRELDPRALHDYLTHLCVPAPRTIFRHIAKLPPASYLTLSLDGGAPVVQRYWDVRFAPDEGVSERAWVERTAEVLDESVRLHMVSDVPVGAFLSGGLDSSSVVASMARASSAPVKTFSIGFDEASFDELAYARQVAARYRTDHVELVLKPDVMEILPRLAWQFDEPFADASAVPTYCVSRITREHVTVALSGDGGDEVFAGYRRYTDAVGLRRQADGFPVALLKPLFRAAARVVPDGVRGRGFLELLGMTPLDRYTRMLTYQTRDSLRALLGPAASPPDALAPDVFAELAREGGAADYLSTLQYVDMRHYLPEDILTKVDRASMLPSLETRVPLLDHVLIEHAARIPARFAMRGGVGKQVLRQAVADRLPDDVLTRAKMGFGVPIAAWFRRELREFATDLLSDPRTRQRGLLAPDAGPRLLAAHLEGRRDWSSQLWSLICLELWCRTWWDR